MFTNISGGYVTPNGNVVMANGQQGVITPNGTVILHTPPSPPPSDALLQALGVAVKKEKHAPPLPDGALQAPALADIPEDALYLIHITRQYHPDTWAVKKLQRFPHDNVYATLVTRQNFDKLQLFVPVFQELKDRFIIQFPVNLLASKNYYINMVDLFGKFDAGLTFMPWELDAAVNMIDLLAPRLATFPTIHGYNEVVFTNSILLPAEEKNTSWRVFAVPKEATRLTDVPGITPERFILPSRTGSSFFEGEDTPKLCLTHGVNIKNQLTAPERKQGLHEMTEAPKSMQALYENTVESMCQIDKDRPWRRYEQTDLNEWLEWRDFQNSRMFQDWQNKSMLSVVQDLQDPHGISCNCYICKFKKYVQEPNVSFEFATQSRNWSRPTKWDWD